MVNLAVFGQLLGVIVRFLPVREIQPVLQSFNSINNHKRSENVDTALYRLFTVYFTVYFILYRIFEESNKSVTNLQPYAINRPLKDVSKD